MLDIMDTQMRGIEITCVTRCLDVSSYELMLFTFVIIRIRIRIDSTLP